MSLADALYYRSSAPVTATDTPTTDLLDPTPHPLTERPWG